jgi:hypothetical protein
MASIRCERERERELELEQQQQQEQQQQEEVGGRREAFCAKWIQLFQPLFAHSRSAAWHAASSYII